MREINKLQTTQWGAVGWQVAEVDMP